MKRIQKIDHVYVTLLSKLCHPVVYDSWISSLIYTLATEGEATSVCNPWSPSFSSCWLIDSV